MPSIPRRALALSLLLAAFGPGRGRAESAKPTAEDPVQSALERLRVSIQRTTLPNGLRVVMQPDTSVPTVAVAMTYDVGAKDEAAGRSGFAHLFEHLMFQGSKHVKPSEHFKLVSARGGIVNGKTSDDRTSFFQTLPANELALGLWLEADRLRWLAVTPQNFETQRKVVLEEHRSSIEDAPYFSSLLRLNELVFQPHLDRRRLLPDLEAARFEWVTEFHRQYYAPNNAVLSIAGDFDPDVAMQLVRRYFRGAETRPRPRYDAPVIAAQTAERRDTRKDPRARTPGLYYGWAIPGARTPAHYALELASLILADGESSRLSQRLVKASGLARSVGAWTDGNRGNDLFVIEALLSSRGDLKAVAREIDAELRRLAQTGPTEAELARARNRLRARFLFGLETNDQRAARLGEFEVFWGDARLITRELDAYLAVNAADIRKSVNEQLSTQRRSAVEVLPEAPAKASAKP
jgi:zinc protease